MRRVSQNTFNQGMKMDLNPLTTPNNILTDALNGTIITYNGNEFVLQNDMGNCKVDNARLRSGFIPMGMKEYGGIIYVASLNPITGECQVGSFPSPQENFNPTDDPGLTPIELLTSEFVLETNTTTESSTKFLGKLSIPELFQMAPGDLYVVTFTINEPGGDPDDPTNIDTLGKMNNYISSDPADRKLFFLQFYKIAGNNLTSLPASSVNVIQSGGDLSEDYKYFTQNSKCTLVIGLQFEQLDYFNAEVVDTSLNVDTNKSVAIKATGFSNSMADFQGVKVIITSPSSDSFYIDKATDTQIASATVSGLSAGDNFQCSITPYCGYCLFPKLRQDFRLTIGQYFSAGSGVNNIFQYFVDEASSTIQVNFDFKFQGNSSNGLHLYMEMYDPWSDYSVVKTVDSPTYYGVNTVTFGLVNEPLIDQFDDTTVGGTLATKITTSTDTTYQKVLLPSANQVRRDTNLRVNSFYIVRISGVDKIITDGVITYTHYDFYKGLYTNDMFNNVYTQQAGLSTTDPTYVSDFNTLDFDISTIFYDTASTLTSNVSLAPTVALSRPDLMTTGQYYAVETSPQSTSPGYKYSQTYESRKTYGVNLTLEGTQRVFGQFKDSLISLTPPTLQDSDGTDSLAQKPTIVDAGYDNNSDISPNTLAQWSIANVSGSDYILSTDTFTTRSVYADVVEHETTAKVYKEIPLADSLWYSPTNEGTYTAPDSAGGFALSPAALMLIQKYTLTVRGPGDVIYTYPLSDGESPADTNVTATVNSGVNTDKTYSAVVITSGEPTWGYGSGSGVYNSCRDNGLSPWKMTSMLMKMGDGTYRMTKVTDLQAMIQFFNSLFVTSSVDTDVWVYYPNPSVASNGNIQSTITYPDMIFTTTFTPDTSGMDYILTYLSTFRFKSLDEITDFKASTLNDYIASKQGDSIIVDEKNTLRDGFIPFISAVQTSVGTVPTPSLTITQAANSSVVSQFNAGQSQYPNDPAFKGGPHLHGTLWTNIPAFARYISQMERKNVFDDTEVVNTGANAVYVQILGNASIWTTGQFFRASGCRKDNVSPFLVPAIDITKQ